jgi:hypothetical protein
MIGPNIEDVVEWGPREGGAVNLVAGDGVAMQRSPGPHQWIELEEIELKRRQMLKEEA